MPGFGSVTLDLSFICECQCEQPSMKVCWTTSSLAAICKIFFPTFNVCRLGVCELSFIIRPYFSKITAKFAMEMEHWVVEYVNATKEGESGDPVHMTSQLGQCFNQLVHNLQHIYLSETDLENSASVTHHLRKQIYQNARGGYCFACPFSWHVSCLC